MWRLLSRIFFIVIIFSFSGFGEDFEKICHEEILKVKLNTSVIQKSCFKTAKKYEKENKLENASWYYLLSMNFTKNLTHTEDENSSFLFYINQGHTYVLNNDFNKTKIAYENVLTFEIDIDKDVQKDYAILMNLYPNKKDLLEQGLEIWNHANRTFFKIIQLGKEYDELYDNHEYDLMIKKLNEIIDLKKQTILVNSTSHMMDYYHLAYIHEQRKHHQKAINNYTKSLNIAQSLLDKGHVQIGTIHNSLGLVYNELKKYQEAKKHYKKALNIYIKEYGENDDLIAIIFNNLATIYGDQKEYKNAIKHYNKALKIEKENHSKSIVNTYYNLGLLYQQMKEYDKVLPFYKKTLPFIENNSTAMATYYTLNGAYYQEVEENKQALFFYKKALKIRKIKLGEEHTDTAESYNSLGSIYEALKDFKQALYFYKKALKINKIYLDKNDVFIAISYNNIASIHTELEEYQEGKSALTKTLEIKNNIFKKDDIDFAVTYTNLGFIEEKLKNYKSASNYYTKAFSIYSQNKGEKSLEIAILYNHIASLYKEQKQYPSSIEYLKKAKNIMNNILSKNHSEKSLIYNNLGLLYSYVNAYKEAYAHNLLSFQIFLHNRNKNFKILNSKQKGLYLESFGNRIDNLYSSAYQNLLHNGIKNLPTTMFTTWLNYKGTLFEYQNILSMVKNNPNTPKKIINTIDTLNQLNSQLSDTKEKEEEKRIEEKIHQIEIQLSEKNESLKRILSLNDINTTQIKNHLKPHQLYIDFARGDDNYYIFTLDYQNNISFQQIAQVHTKEIDQNIKIYRENTTNIAYKLNRKILTLDYENTSHTKAKNILSQLYTTLIEKYLKGIIKDKTDLIISPDGLLNYFPFEALYHNGKYLVEDYTINYISSGKEFVRQTKIQEKKPIHQMTIFANTNFNALLKSSLYDDKPESKIEKVPLEPLGDREIKIIKKHYKEPIIFDANNSNIHNLVNMPSSKIIHISTHGEILKDTSILNPMRKAVLYFAGANVSSDKGTISALKLSAMDFKDTELVVLSACESGLGSIQNAEGVIGLPKALLQAGTKNVLMSLWTVSNAQTANLMDFFYANILNKQSYNVALQNAKKEMIKIHPHPYYWSAFILNGL